MSPGFTLRKEGGVGMPGGKSGMAAAIAVSTSTVAPSISRLRSNWSVILVLPWPLFEVIESRPAIFSRVKTSATDNFETRAMFKISGGEKQWQ